MSPCQQLSWSWRFSFVGSFSRIAATTHHTSHYCSAGCYVITWRYAIECLFQRLTWDIHWCENVVYILCLVAWNESSLSPPPRVPGLCSCWQLIQTEWLLWTKNIKSKLLLISCVLLFQHCRELRDPWPLLGPALTKWSPRTGGLYADICICPLPPY